MKSFPSSKQLNDLPSNCEAGTLAADLFSQQKIILHKQVTTRNNAVAQQRENVTFYLRACR